MSEGEREARTRMLQAMTPEQRSELGLQMTEAARAAMRAAIRERHPEYDDEQLKFAFFRQWLGDDDLFRKAWPHAPVLDP